MSMNHRLPLDKGLYLCFFNNPLPTTYTNEPPEPSLQFIFVTVAKANLTIQRKNKTTAQDNFL